jgi:hypothetical protein
MGLDRRTIKRMEKAADEHTTVLTCQDNGEQIRVPEDATVRMVVAQYCEGIGQDYSDPLVDRLSPYVERGLVDEQGRTWPIGDVGGGLHGLTG